MRNILITGANGTVATELIFTLLSESDYRLLLLSSHPDTIKERFRSFSNRIVLFDLLSFSEFVKIHKLAIDCCIHTAFSRSNVGSEIASSLDYQKELIRVLFKCDLKCFVNISSQSIYGTNQETPWKETSSPTPESPYALGKYSSEIITELFWEGRIDQWANIRLCSVFQNARFPRVFVQNAINNAPIHLSAPLQICSFIDVRDVAIALKSLIHKPDALLNKHILNLGANYSNTIKSIAYLVKGVGEEQFCTPNVNITEDAPQNASRVGMDASNFMQAFSWAPKYSIRDMVVNLFESSSNRL